LSNEKSEYTATGWVKAYLFFLVLAQADCEELVESGPGLVEYSERAVASVHQRTSLFDQVSEEDRQFDVGLNHKDRVHQAAELGRIVHTAVRHSCDRTPWPSACGPFHGGRALG
jgi:hypothetical protein